MTPVAMGGVPILTPIAIKEGGTSIDISKISVCSAIGSSVIGISVNDVMAPGRKVTFLKLESKSIPFPVISIYNICWQNI